MGTVEAAAQFATYVIWIPITGILWVMELLALSASATDRPTGGLLGAIAGARAELAQSRDEEQHDASARPGRRGP